MKALLLSALLVMAFMASMTDVMVESSPLTKRSVENVMESPIDKRQYCKYRINAKNT